MPFRSSARVNRLLRARAGAQKVLQAEVLRALQRGWRSLKPRLAGLKKADGDPFDAWFGEWADEFGEAYLSALEKGSAAIGKAEAASWKGYSGGSELDFDPARIAQGYYDEVGSKITRSPTRSTLKRLREYAQDWFDDPEMSLNDLIDRLGPLFGPERAALIGINETTALISWVTSDIMEELGLTRWTWQSRLEWNTCTKELEGPDGNTYAGCRGLHGKEFGLDDAMPPDGSHIGCYCVAAPVVKG